MFSFKFDSIALDQDQDPNWTKILDPDPNSMYLDPQHCSLDPISGRECANKTCLIHANLFLLSLLLVNANISHQYPIFPFRKKMFPLFVAANSVKWYFY